MAVLSVTWSLGLIWDDAADKVRLGAAQVGHQLIQIFLQRETQSAIQHRVTAGRGLGLPPR